MPSPFPGVDPYVEGERWREFHGRLIYALSEEISERLPPRYDAHIEQFVYGLEPEVYRAGVHEATVGCIGHCLCNGPTTIVPTTIALVLLDRIPESYIEIRTQPDRELAAVVQVLSPLSKSDRGRHAYLNKRAKLIESAVHIVEIDLLLEGMRLPMRGPLPPGDCYAFVSRSDRRPDCDVYSWTLRQQLPTIPVPLLGTDPDIQLSIKTAFDLAFDRGRYEHILDYSVPPHVTIPTADCEWVTKRAALALHFPG